MREITMRKKLLGIDLGTGGCKTTFIDLDGNICASSFKEYPSEHHRPGWSEQDPSLWINALLDTVKDCKSQMSDGFSGVICLAVTASTHNAVLLDKHGEVIRRCIMWNDQRSGSQCESLKQQYDETIFRIGMQRPTPTWTLPQLMWVRENEPENFARIDRIMFTKDYVRSWLTGDFCTDVVDAQGSLLYDAREMKWSPELCGMIGLPLQALPEIRLSKEIVGHVQAEAARLTGLPEGLPVIAGCSDTAAEDFSAGATKVGQIIVKLATAGNVNVVADIPNPHSKTFTYPYSIEGLWYTVTATNSCASAYRWLRDSLYCGDKAACEKNGEEVYRLMDEEASSVPLGARGLIFHPYLLGERCPYFNPKARGDFFGLSMVHSRPHFARALLEGVAFSLYDCLQVLADFNRNLEDIAIIGGGAKSPLWSQIICDVFGLEVKFPRNAESSYGGALLAGVGAGVFQSEYEAAEKCIKMNKTYVPNMENHEKYLKYYKIYKEIADASFPIWENIAQIANE